MADNDQSSDNAERPTSQTSFQDSAVENSSQSTVKPKSPTEEQRAIHFGHGNPLNFKGMS